MRIEATDLGQYLTDFYTGIRETDVLVNIENKLFDELKKHMAGVLDNQFITTCDASVILAWERILGIRYDPNTETESFRRERIVNRLSTRPPFTLRFLINRLDQILGRDSYEVRIDHDNYTLYIESAISEQMWYTEVTTTMHRIKPANMVLILVPVLYAGVVLQERGFISEMAFMRAGFWVVGETPIEERKVEVEVNLL